MSSPLAQSGMDRPRPAPPHPALRRWSRRLTLVLALFAIVFAVGSLPVLFVYFAGLKNDNVAGAGREAAAEDAPSATPEGLRPERVAAFVGVNIIPLDRERIVVNQTVIVREGRIAAVGPANDIEVPKGALRIEARGAYLVPGLVDMHVHLRGDRATMLGMLDLFVINGVTTVVNLYGTPEHLELRARAARNELLAPTIYTSGPFISDAPHNQPTAEEVESAVVEQKRAGYDLIKIHGDFTRDAYHRLFQTARREGMKVIGHAPRNLGTAPMIEERQDAVAHAEEYLYAYFFYGRRSAWRDPTPAARQKMIREQERRIPSLAAATARAGTWVVPTLTVFKGIGEQVKDIERVLAREEVRYTPPLIRLDWAPARNTYVRRFRGAETISYFATQYGLLEKLVKGLRDAGVKLLAGTDTPVPAVVPGFSLHDELEDLVAAGLTPYEALRAATINAAEFLGAQSEFGAIEAGRRADLILLKENPFMNITATRRRAGVMVRGEWFSEERLSKRLARLASNPLAREN